MQELLSQGPAFILCLVVMLALVVVVHELGHYVAGRFFGAAVESFSIGFGRSIWERTDRHGTRWRINWIPLGGFVKFVGEAQLPNDVGEVELGPEGLPYGELSVGARSIVSVAGPLANFLLAIVLFTIIIGFNGDYRSRVEVAGLAEGYPAIDAGLEVGDVLVEVNGLEILRPADVPKAVLMTSGEEIDIVIERQGSRQVLPLTPIQTIRDNGLGQMMPHSTIGVILGIVEGTERVSSVGPIEALSRGVGQTGFVLQTTVTMMGRLVTGREPLASLSGPVAIGDTGRRLFNRTIGRDDISFWAGLQAFFWNILGISAAISIGIGFFNLLPLPVLDGGHLVFNAYEAVTGRVLPEKVQELALMAGLGLLMTLFVFITWGDILETGLFGPAGG